MKNRDFDFQSVDFIFDMVSERKRISSNQVARAALVFRGSSDDYLKIESWIVSMGYEKRMLDLKVIYIPIAKKEVISNGRVL